MENEKIKELITIIWEKVNEEVNLKPLNFPSEKTLVFRFAWLLQKEIGFEIDFLFEKIVLKAKNNKKKTFLDLFFEINNYKIGIEFKFPKKSEFSSNNQTQRRIATLKDIERLNELIFEKELDLGVFLLTSDIKAYSIDTGNRKKSNDYKIHQGFKFKKDEFLPPNCDNRLALVCDIVFEWVNLEKIKPKECFAYVKPIFIALE